MTIPDASEPVNVEAGNAWAIKTVDTPCPQPTSATVRSELKAAMDRLRAG